MDITLHRSAPRTESAIAVQVKRQSLEEMHDIPQPITASLEHLELVVQPFHEATGLMVDEIVRNQVEPSVQQLQKGGKAGQPTMCDRCRQKWMRRSPSAFERAVSKMTLTSSRNV